MFQRLKTFVTDNRIPLIVAAAFFMETLDGSIIVTALPSIAQGFGETTLALSVAISAYMIALAVFVPMAGWASERYGSRRVFATAVGVFTFASLLCGLSPNFWSFIASRVLQGSAAAFMSPVGRLVVLRETPKNRLIESLGLIVWPALSVESVKVGSRADCRFRIGAGWRFACRIANQPMTRPAPTSATPVLRWPGASAMKARPCSSVTSAAEVTTKPNRSKRCRSPCGTWAGT